VQLGTVGGWSAVEERQRAQQQARLPFRAEQGAQVVQHLGVLGDRRGQLGAPRGDRRRFDLGEASVVGCDGRQFVVHRPHVVRPLTDAAGSSCPLGRAACTRSGCRLPVG
jgi:hypothetical protein